MASAVARSALNSSGGTKRLTSACLRVGCRYWPMVRKSTSAARRSSITCSTSSRSSPSPTMMPDLVNMVGRQLLHLLQQPQRGEVARTGADLRDRAPAPSRGCGCRRRGRAATTVSTAPSLRRKSGVSTSMVVAGVRARMARMVCGEMLGAAVGEIVAIDRGDDDVRQAQLGDGRRPRSRARPDRAARAAPSPRCRRRRRACRCRP